jgi:hypothetical protein
VAARAAYTPSTSGPWHRSKRCLTFPIVLDHNEASHKAWAFGGYPFWLLLDSRGRVIEARFKPQTAAQLTTMLAEPRTLH